MAGGEPLVNGAARVPPKRARLLRRGLLATYLGIPALAALYGLHRGGGAEGAMVGAITALIGESLMMFDAVHLLNWLVSDRRRPSWRHERLYWSLTVGLAAAVLVAVTMVFGEFDPVEKHSVNGFLDGFVAGVVCGGFTGFLAARFHAWLRWLGGPWPADDSDNRSTLQTILAPTLSELEAVRLDAGRHIRRRAAWLTPIGAGVLLTAWLVWLALTRDLNLLAPPVAILVGGLIGHVVAVRRLAAEYERLYKARVLPLLAALFGALTFKRPPPPDLARLRRFHVFRHFDAAVADDALVGKHRGLTLSIVQLRLTHGWGPARRTAFHGLLIEVALKNRLSGVTAVAADAGAFGNLRDALAARNVQRVGLESAAFEREYEVYATDQVTARALLTPDFMERFMALGRSEGFGRPLALAQDNLLLLAMPRTADEDYFAPPSYEQSATDDGVLGRLYRDIKAVLAAADSVIALDEATSLHANSSRRPSRAERAVSDAVAEELGDDP